MSRSVKCDHKVSKVSFPRVFLVSAKFKRKFIKKTVKTRSREEPWGAVRSRGEPWGAAALGNQVLEIK